MANRRSDPNRSTTQTPARTPAPSRGQSAIPTPTRTAAPTQVAVGSSTTARPAGLTPSPTPAKSSSKGSSKAAPRRARRAKSNPPSRSVAVSGDQRRTMIAEAAYFHAEMRGFAPGGEVGDWLVAEAEVDALLKDSSGVPQ